MGRGAQGVALRNLLGKHAFSARVPATGCGMHWEMIAYLLVAAFVATFADWFFT